LLGAAEVLAAWCETPRHFRLDRITAADPTGERIPKRQRILLAEWRAREDIDAVGQSKLRSGGIT
jgi:predicted DNA-binding transcriptional regulator YafY